MAYYSFSEAFFWPIHPRTHERDIVTTRGKYTRVLKGNPTKTINMAVVKKIFPIISRFSLFKRSECSSSLLRIDKRFLLRNCGILTSGKLCFLDNADLINMNEHAILSEQNNCKSTCSLPSFWLIAVVTALVFGLSRHKVAHAAGKENDPSHALTKCRLERKRKLADKMRSLRAGKDTNAEPPAKQQSPGRDEEPTDSQVSSYTMDAIDIGYHCHM